MTQQHPITPSDELIGKWIDTDEGGPSVISRIATRAAQWGADQELEACCEWLKAKHWIEPEFSDELRAARRPKPPSLKELALKALNEAVYMAEDIPPEGISTDQADTIRRALEQLDD
jgi:hypothetical protein